MPKCKFPLTSPLNTKLPRLIIELLKLDYTALKTYNYYHVDRAQPLGPGSHRLTPVSCIGSHRGAADGKDLPVTPSFSSSLLRFARPSVGCRASGGTGRRVPRQLRGTGHPRRGAIRARPVPPSEARHRLRARPTRPLPDDRIAEVLLYARPVGEP